MELRTRRMWRSSLIFAPQLDVSLLLSFLLSAFGKKTNKLLWAKGKFRYCLCLSELVPAQMCEFIGSKDYCCLRILSTCKVCGDLAVCAVINATLGIAHGRPGLRLPARVPKIRLKLDTGAATAYKMLQRMQQHLGNGRSASANEAADCI